MKLYIKYNSYNPRRYSKPWGARLGNWEDAGKPEMRWGAYLGSAEGGDLEIDAEPGDVVRWGQKDNRGNNTDSNWGIVRTNGTIAGCTPAEARKHWLERGEKTQPVEYTP